VSSLQACFSFLSSSTDLSDIIFSVESSEPFRTASGGMGDVSGSDHMVYPVSNYPSYEWVDPRVLDVPTCFSSLNAFR